MDINNNKNSYYGVMEEIWELEYRPMGKTNWRWHKERSIWNENSRPDQDWFQR
jgi:hypothetical protein